MGRLVIDVIASILFWSPSEVNNIDALASINGVVLD